MIQLFQEILRCFQVKGTFGNLSGDKFSFTWKEMRLINYHLLTLKLKVLSASSIIRSDESVLQS